MDDLPDAALASAFFPGLPDVESPPGFGECRESGIAVARKPCLIALILKDSSNQLPDIGFIVDDLEKYTARVKQNGGSFHRELKGGGGVDFERKFRDPTGVVFDISHKGWVGIK